MTNKERILFIALICTIVGMSLWIIQLRYRVQILTQSQELIEVIELQRLNLNKLNR